MQALILIGVKYPKTGGKVVENLYTGLDGVALEAAAEKAAASMDYVEIGKVVNPSCTPMAIHPQKTVATKPTFTRPKPLPAPQSKRNPLDDQQDALRKQRAERLKPTDVKKAPEGNSAASGNKNEPNGTADAKKAAEATGKQEETKTP